MGAQNASEAHFGVGPWRGAANTVSYGLMSLVRNRNTQLSVMILILAAAVAATHWPALSAQALSFDDSQYLTENPLVQNPSWASVRRFFVEVLEPSTVKGYYQPLTMISLMIDYAMGGHVNNLRPFHVTNLLLHILNTALIALLLYQLFGRLVTAVMAGLLFGLHPMTIEPISWLTERKTLLAAFFVLWSAFFYLGAVRQKRLKWYYLSYFTYTLALMSKPTSVPLPLLFLCLDFWPLKRLDRHAIMEKIPFFAIGIVSAVITFISQDRTAVTILPGESGLRRTVLVVCYDLMFYLSKIVRPVNLTSYYPTPRPFDLSNQIIMTSVIFSSVLLLGLFISLRWTRALFVGWFAFFLHILPTLGIIGFTNVIAADKYAYLPAFGLLLPIASLLERLWRVGLRRKGLVSLRVGLLILVTILCVSEAKASRRYYPHWRDSVTLYRHMLSLAPDVATLHSGLGLALEKRGDVQAAMIHYKESIRLAPEQSEVYMDLGLALMGRGKYDEAMRYCLEAARLRPADAKPWVGIGLVYAELGRYDEALTCYEKALKLQPTQAEAYNNIGVIFLDQGEIEKAVINYEAALRFRPSFNIARINLAVALAGLGRYEAAKAECIKALRLEPESAQAHFCLANLHLACRENDKAIAHYREAIRFDPKMADVHGYLGVALARVGRSEEAVMEFREELKNKPDNADTQYNLGITLAKLGRSLEAAEAFRAAFRINPTHEGAIKSLREMQIAAK
ncbi:MAG: tetratricopeptide repeat protein [Bacteroidota bacterium]